MTRPTLDQVKTWPPTVSIAEASAAFGFSRSFGYELAKRGEFPAKVLPVQGRIYRVSTASILAALDN